MVPRFAWPQMNANQIRMSTRQVPEQATLGAAPRHEPTSECAVTQAQ